MSEKTHAVVLSGCGSSSTSTYEIGAMRALLEKGCVHTGGKPLDPAVFAGSGFGAVHAAVMAGLMGGDAAGSLRYLETLWLDTFCAAGSRPNGIYRLRGLGLLDPTAWLNPFRVATDAAGDFVYLAGNLAERVQAFLGSDQGGLTQRILSIPDLTPLFDMTRLRENLRKHVDLAKLRATNKELLVIASDWNAGLPCVFRKRDFTDDRGHDILQASAAFLLAFPFVEIDGKPYGGAPGTMATPVTPVIAQSADPAKLVIHVVFLDPHVANLPVPPMSSALDGLGHYFSMNEELNVHSKFNWFSQPDAQAPTAAPPGWGSVLQQKPVEIHWYRPRAPQVNWFQFATFDPDLTRGFIKAGYEDTLAHDCRQQGCIVP